jgi:hypothetical protein
MIHEIMNRIREELKRELAKNQLEREKKASNDRAKAGLGR